MLLSLLSRAGSPSPAHGGGGRGVGGILTRGTRHGGGRLFVGASLAAPAPRPLAPPLANDARTSPSSSQVLAFWQFWQRGVHVSHATTPSQPTTRNSQLTVLSCRLPGRGTPWLSATLHQPPTSG